MKHTIAAKADDLVFPATHQGDVAVGTASFQHRPALHLMLSLLPTSSNFCPSTLLMFCPLIGNKHGKNEVMKQVSAESSPALLQSIYGLRHLRLSAGPASQSLGPVWTDFLST